MALPVNGSTHLIPAYYSFYHPRKDERLSWPSWQTYNGGLTHISGHPSAAGRAQDRESSPARDRRSTIVPRHQLYKSCSENINSIVFIFNFAEVMSTIPLKLWQRHKNGCATASLPHQRCVDPPNPTLSEYVNRAIKQPWFCICTSL